MERLIYPVGIGRTHILSSDELANPAGDNNQQTRNGNNYAYYVDLVSLMYTDFQYIG